MIISSRVVGHRDVNAYLIGDEHTKEALLIDPGGDPEDLLTLLDTHHLKLKALLATHAHYDHVEAANALRDATGAPLLIHPLEEETLARAADEARAEFGGDFPPVRGADGFMVEGDLLRVGEVDVRVLETPGHTPGGISFVAELGMLETGGATPLPGAVFTGDSLLRESIGRTQGAGADRQALIDAIRRKLLTLPPATMVFPGHGASTTIAHEAQHNPFLNPGARRN